MFGRIPFVSPSLRMWATEPSSQQADFKRGGGGCNYFFTSSLITSSPFWKMWYILIESVGVQNESPQDVPL